MQLWRLAVPYVNYDIRRLKVKLSSVRKAIKWMSFILQVWHFKHHLVCWLNLTGAMGYGLF